jgi:hypothetical protein
MSFNAATIKWIILLCIFPLLTNGQDSFYKVYLKSKNKIIGQLIKEESNKLTLKIADSSYVTVYEQDIKKVQRLYLKNFKNGLFWEESIFSHRYFFSPSAFMLKKGEVSMRNVLGFYNGLEYGVNDKLSIGGGLSFFPLIVDNDATSVYILTAKYGGWKLTDKFTASLSFFYSDVNDRYPEPLRSDKHLSVSALFTYGNLNNHLTFGAGRYRHEGDHEYYDLTFSSSFSYIDEYKTQWFNTYQINGALRLAPNFSLVTENWIVSNNEYSDFLSFGIRFSKLRFMAELALIYKTEANIINKFTYSELLPYLNIAYQF